MENNVIITVFQTQDDEKTQVLYDGVARIERLENGCILDYQDDKEKTHLNITSNSCTIERFGDHETDLCLSINETSYILVKTEYGTLRLEAETIGIVLDEQVLSVQYDIKEGNKIVSMFTITWLIKEALS
jgi:Uncharacterized protein conserved in bacteria